MNTTIWFRNTLTLLALLTFISCAAKQQRRDAMSSIDSRLGDLQRSIDLLGQKLESNQNDVMVLQDQMESTRIQVQKMEYQASKTEATRSAGRVGAAPTKSLPPLIEIRSIESPRKDKQSGSDNDNPLKLYRDAYALYEANKQNEAIEKFSDFVKQNPQHDYADNAIYWMGESYYDQKEFMLAITEFRRVIREYPTSNKLADAFLKIGMCYERLDDRGEATKAYASVQEQYPYSPAAQRAQERLAKLQAATPLR